MEGIEFAKELRYKDCSKSCDDVMGSCSDKDSILENIANKIFQLQRRPLSSGFTAAAVEWVA
jgi:hypothetical protein